MTLLLHYIFHITSPCPSTMLTNVMLIIFLLTLIEICLTRVVGGKDGARVGILLFVSGAGRYRICIGWNLIALLTDYGLLETNGSNSIAYRV